MPTSVAPVMAPTVFLLLLLACAGASQVQRVSGQLRGETCMCPINITTWTFPTLRYEAVQQLVESCQDSINMQNDQMNVSSERLPKMQALLRSLEVRLEPYNYMENQGLHTVKWLQTLGQEMKKLETDIGHLHHETGDTDTHALFQEATKLREDVEKMYVYDSLKIVAVKEQMRYLKNRAESCRSIPKDFRGTHSSCLKGLITNISSPVVTKVSPYGKSYTSGSWGKQAQRNSPNYGHSYWVQPLVSTNAWGNTLRLYSSYENFIASTNHEEVTFAPSYSNTNANEGPSTVLYGDGLFYHCYNSADICRYDLTTKTMARITLPGNGFGFNNKFPYCYYSCHPYSDIDLEADETGLWAIYVALGSHGNMVVSRLEWDGNALNITQTWETRMFKKAVTNAFMTCGVLYATRYGDDSYEEVFYAFDTATGREDHSLALPLEKVSKGVASLSYNPQDNQLYMYNDGYLLAYQAMF